ncbi:hypothetical protein M569_09768 [Genlisea aurea]|uniref:Uncharacterized protein n=1 Tax=Genlisea aurea TaxID=192259 RepID=S8CDI1_9LAMI|nr:hypothetical protein M569_09768 [Genlisea aurea]
MAGRQAQRNGTSSVTVVRHMIQICLVLGVAVWLLYQLQQSLNIKSAAAVRNMEELGRKDLKNDDLSPQDQLLFDPSETNATGEIGIEENVVAMEEETRNDHESGDSSEEDKWK